MIITKIVLENWKNFRYADVTCGKRVFLIGPNASGKSNFLDALRFLRDVAEDGLEKAVDKRGGMKAIRFLSARQKPDIKISVTLDDSWEYTLIFGTEKGKQIPLVREEEVIKVSDEGRKIILARPDDEDKKDIDRLTQTALQQVNANVDFRDIPKFFSTIQYRHILPQLVRNPEGFSITPVRNDPYGRDLVLQIWKTSPAARDRRLNKINKALKEAVPGLKSLSVKQDENGLPHLEVNYQNWRAHGAYQNETTLSDGTLRMLALLWTLLDSGGPLLLEEPELSLHEGIVQYLPQLFSNMDKGKKKAVRQVFITTHSNALLKDSGVGANEVLRLEPDAEGTSIQEPSAEDIALMENGLSAAEVLLPRTTPKGAEQFYLFEL